MQADPLTTVPLGNQHQLQPSTRPQSANTNADADRHFRGDAKTQISGAKPWPFNTTERRIIDPQEQMIRLVVNDDKHLLTFCCCMFWNVVSIQEDLDDMNEGLCADDRLTPLYVPDFMNVVFEQLNIATVVALSQQLHETLEHFISRGHPLRTSPAVLGIFRVSTISL